MVFDRSKYAKASPEELQKQEEQVAEFLPGSDGRAGFLSMNPGLNVFRIYPAQMKVSSRNFLYPKIVSWLPFSREAKDKEGNIIYDSQTGKPKIEKGTKPVFNARHHGKLSKDLVEVYISFVEKELSEEIQDKKELELRLSPIKDWKHGILYKTSWIAYSEQRLGAGTKFGRVEVTEGVRRKLNSLAQRQSDSGSPITLDLYSHPDTGKPIQIKYDKNAKDKKNTYEVSLLFEEDWVISDESLEKFEELESLKDLLGEDVYKRGDFNAQLFAIELIDSTEHTMKDSSGKTIAFKYNIFKNEEFLDIVEGIVSEVEKYYPEEEEQGEDQGQSSESDPNSESENDNIPPNEEIANDLETIVEKSELLAIYKFIEGENIIKPTISLAGIRDEIRDTLVSKFGIEEIALLSKKVKEIIISFNNSKTASGSPITTPKVEGETKKVNRLDEMRKKYNKE